VGQLQLNDGSTMAYAEHGAGRPLLLVHGWAASGRFFHPQQSALQNDFRIITPDLRGHGASPAPDGEASVELLAADLTALADRLDLEDAVAVGWSMGAMVLWRALRLGLADRLAGMVVVDMTPRIVNDAEWSLGLKGGYDLNAADAARRAMLADWPGYGAAMARSVVAEGLEPERRQLIEWIALSVARNAPGPLAQLWGSLAGQDFRDELAAIGTPTLIAHGARSQLYPTETSRFLEDRLPDARRITFERSGHAPHLEEPETFNRVVTEFAASLKARDQRTALRSAGAASQPRGGTP
jgi:pimeloyl-ACP methyl ester carboxylesterase